MHTPSRVYIARLWNLIVAVPHGPKISGRNREAAVYIEIENITRSCITLQNLN